MKIHGQGRSFLTSSPQLCLKAASSHERLVSQAPVFPLSLWSSRKQDLGRKQGGRQFQAVSQFLRHPRPAWERPTPLQPSGRPPRAEAWGTPQVQPGFSPRWLAQRQCWREADAALVSGPVGHLGGTAGLKASFLEGTANCSPMPVLLRRKPGLKGLARPQCTTELTTGSRR